jgi:hypothetical protein
LNSLETVEKIEHLDAVLSWSVRVSEELICLKRHLWHHLLDWNVVRDIHKLWLDELLLVGVEGLLLLESVGWSLVAHR